MPNMAAVGMVPFIPRGESAKLSQQSRALPSHQAKPRVYDDEPLPIRPSSSAPRNARIVNRILDDGVVTFELQIGNTTISDVGLDEVLDYVSMYELEEYENRAFKDERELLRIAEEEEQRVKAEKLERMKERAKLKGRVLLSESDDEGRVALVTSGRDDEDVAFGKHGRARPSYKHLYKVNKERRRRRRDSETGELLPLSDEEDGQALGSESSEDEGSRGNLYESTKPTSSRAPLEHPVALPKRRRRKRDPVTGELMPLVPVSLAHPEQGEERTMLAPVKQPPLQLGEKAKRPRRRRHPLTGELMPLGWRYDPEAERSGKAGKAATITVPDVKRLSISQEYAVKRRRLDEQSSEEQRSASPAVRLASSARTGGALDAFKSGAAAASGSSEDEESGEEIAVVRPGPKPKLLRRSVGGTSMPQSTATSTAPESSPEPAAAVPVDKRAGAVTLPDRSLSQSSSSSIIPLQANSPPSRGHQHPAPSIRSPPAKGTTSILHPTASAVTDASSESDSEEMEDDEWAIEAILAHGKSNPKTHPPGMGKTPVVLYQVKWEGSDDMTWEPLSSFKSFRPLREYQRKKGLPVEPESEGEEGD